LISQLSRSGENEFRTASKSTHHVCFLGKVLSCFTSYVGSQPQRGFPTKPRVGARNERLPWVRGSPLLQPQRGCPTLWTSARCKAVGQPRWGCGVCGGITQGRRFRANPGLCWETPLGFRCSHQTPFQILSSLWDNCAFGAKVEAGLQPAAGGVCLSYGYAIGYYEAAPSALQATYGFRISLKGSGSSAEMPWRSRREEGGGHCICESGVGGRYATLRALCHRTP
jgi:hypothetical protein